MCTADQSVATAVADRSPAAGPAGARWFAWMVVAVVAGVAFRVQQFRVGRAFGVDECSLLLNVVGKSARQLLGPLDRAQAAPPLFLLVLRGCHVLLGDGELSFHAWSLGCGVAALILFAGLAWRLLSPAAAVVVTALFAASDRLVWHAVEAKQYSGDVLVCVVLLWLGTGLRRPPATRLWTAAAMATVAIWLSHPTLFVFAAVSASLWPQRSRDRIGYLAANGLFAASAATLFRMSIRVQRTDALTHMWDGQFVPWSRPSAVLPWLLRSLVSLANYPLEGPGGACLLALAVLGTLHLVRGRRRRTAILLTAPIGLLILCAAVRAYPFGGHRLTLFYAPMLLLLVGYGIDRWRSDPPGPVRRTWWAVPALLIVWATVGAAYHVVRPETTGPLRPALAYLRGRWRPGDGVYVVGQNTGPIFAWYSRASPWLAAYRDPYDGPDVPLPFDQVWVVGLFHARRLGLVEMKHDLLWAGRAATETDRMVAAECAAVKFQRRRATPMTADPAGSRGHGGTPRAASGATADPEVSEPPVRLPPLPGAGGDPRAAGK